CTDAYSSLFDLLSCLLVPHSTLPPFFFFPRPPTTAIYTLSLHDALPISAPIPRDRAARPITARRKPAVNCANISPGARVLPRCRSEEHTSELQSRFDLVCRLLLEKKKIKNNKKQHTDSTKPLHRTDTKSS